MVKGEDKYPRTIAATLRFLQYHNLRGRGVNDDRKHLKDRSETAFAQVDEDSGSDSEKESKSGQRKNKTCGFWQKGSWDLKIKHTWR